MYTLGYSFKPWTEAKAIADGASILDYVRDTAREHGIDRKIRFGHRVVRAEWSTADARWTVEAERAARRRDGRPHLRLPLHVHRLLRLRRAATRPSSRASSASGGQIVHPQHWTDDLDYAGKRVVVIGSGATAVTLVPGDGRGGRARDDAAALADLRRLAAGARTRRHVAARGVLPAQGRLLARALEERAASRCRASSSAAAGPQLMRALLRRRVERDLPAGYDVDTHFNPTLRPVGPAPLPRARRRPLQTRSGAGARRSSPTASTPSPRRGLALASGDELEADLVVTATGLNLLALGGMRAGRRRRARSSSPTTHRLQGHDARAACRTWRSRSATRTPPGRSSATSPASTSAGCSTTWTPPAMRSAPR